MYKNTHTELTTVIIISFVVRVVVLCRTSLFWRLSSPPLESIFSLFRITTYKTINSLNVMKSICLLLIFSLVLKGLSYHSKFSHISLKSDFGFESTWKPTQISNCKVSLSNFQWACGLLRGLKLTSAVSKNELLVILKQQDCLHVTQNCPDVAFSEIWPEIGGNSRLSMLLLQGWLNRGNNQEFIDAYIASLPHPGSLGTPLHWNIQKLRNNPYRYLYR